MASTMQQHPQRLGERAQRVLEALPSVPYGTPTGHYKEDGDFYLDFPWEIAGQPGFVRAFRAVIAANLPAEMVDYEDENPDNPDTMWTHWRYGPRTEAIARLFWPDLHVTAAKNPRYEQGGDLAKQLKTMRQALVAAEAAVRCGVAVGVAR